MCPQTKVVISTVAPVLKKDLDVKRDAFNALNKSEMINDSSMSFLSHDNLDAMSWRYMHKDGIHPTKDGSSILARNLGRHICSVLWKVVHHKNRRPMTNRPYDKNFNWSGNMHDRGCIGGFRYLDHPPLSTRNRFEAFNNS